MHQASALFALSNAPKKSHPSSSYSFILKELFLRSSTAILWSTYLVFKSTCVDLMIPQRGLYDYARRRRFYTTALLLFLS